MLHFVQQEGAKKILLSDQAKRDRFAHLLEDFSSLPLQCEFGTHSNAFVDLADIVIKNPAIPHHAPILQYAIKQKKEIHTDISLFFDQNRIRKNKTRVSMVTGTKGKSSISNALHTLLAGDLSPEESAQGYSCRSALVGNITESPLKLLYQNRHPVHSICELSAQQIGDLKLISWKNSEDIDYYVFSNFMRDHLNFFDSIESYFEHKSYLFAHASQDAHIIIPNDSWGKKLKHLAPSTDPANFVWHSATPLEASKRGSWFHEGKIYHRKEVGGPVHCNALPYKTYSYLLQNILVVMAYCIASNKEIPQEQKTWEHLFTLQHRKESLGMIHGRLFINDSAATIPQAMQIEALPQERIHLLCGGSDKELLPEDIVPECKNAVHCYLLQGSYSSKIEPLLKKEAVPYSGPFDSLEAAVQTAYKNSREGDCILLSPGCASFGMFLHEFDRGDRFKKVIRALLS